MSAAHTPTAIITGATSGFGWAIARRLAREGWDLILNGRRTDRLQTLQEELLAAFGEARSSVHDRNSRIHVLPGDVRHQDEVLKSVDELPVAWKHIDLLVNNAGLALGRDYFDDASLDDWNIMLDTNVKGLLYMTKAVIPYLKTSRRPHIINIGSTAGKEVYEKGNVYCATKHAVDALTKAMRVDLLRHGIKVTAIHPGAADTEFSWVRFKGNDSMARSVYEGYEPLHADDIADVVSYCVNLPAHVCLNDVVMTCTAQANSFYLHKP